MADRLEDDLRPAKRARLDDSTAPTLAPETSVQAPQNTSTATKPTSTNAIDEDLEREVRAGIIEYVCPDNLGFTGVLKQRYTDFLVNEIGLDGQVLHLTGTEVPKKEDKTNGAIKENTKPKEEKVETLLLQEDSGDAVMVDVQPEAPREEAVAKDQSSEARPEIGEATETKQEPEEELPEEDRTTLLDIFGEDVTERIIRLVGQIRKREERKAKDFKAVFAGPIIDKETRTQAHQSLRRIFPNLLESAMEADQTIRIKAAPPADRKGKKGGGQSRSQEGSRKRGGLAWEEHGGEYLHFTLYKENKDTMEVVGFLGSKLNCGSKGFGFAGTKDRRACTVQRVCVKRQTAERMYHFNKTLFNAAIGDWKYERYNLTLGDLKGNEFTITLRDAHFQGEDGLDVTQRHSLAHEIVQKAISDFSEKGFINYYGLQRFGSFAASTDAIGKKMLQEDLAAAVADILSYNDIALSAAQGTLPSDSTVQVSQDDRNRAQALHIWRTQHKGGDALDILPRKFTAERNIIQHLSSRNSKTGQHDRKSDWQGALMTIPRTLRLMYVHAYQSLVWNIVAGKRWSTYGSRIVEGDLVLVHEHRDKEINKTEIPKEDIDANGEMIINPTGSENANAAAADFERARPLTKDEAESGKYTIWDIVLPQPGYDVEYPANDIGEFYKEFMKSEAGGGLDPHDMRRSWREISLSGGYRKVLARPLQPLSFSVHRYVKVDEQFVETDLQRVREKEEEKGAPPRRENGNRIGNGNENGNGKREAAEGLEDGEEGEEKEEEKLAVVIKLQLGSSQYATMALRELMKAGGVKAYKPEFMGGR